MLIVNSTAVSIIPIAGEALCQSLNSFHFYVAATEIYPGMCLSCPWRSGCARILHVLRAILEVYQGSAILAARERKKLGLYGVPSVP